MYDGLETILRSKLGTYIDDDVYSDLNATERKNVKTLNDFVDEIEQLEEQQEAIQYRWGNGY